MNRLGLIWFQDRSEIEFERENIFWKSLEEVTSNVVALCETNYENVIHALEEDDSFQNYDEIILVNSSLIGPFYSLQNILESMDSVEADFWGLLKYAPMFTSDKKTIPSHIDSHFLVFRRSCSEKLFSKELKTSVEENCGNGLSFDIAFTYSLEQIGCVGKVYCSTKEYENIRNCNNFNYFFGKAYDLVRKKGCPFVPYQVFTHKNLKTDQGNDARKLMEYIGSQSEELQEYFWKKLLKYADIGDIYRGLHLDYVLSKYHVNFREKIENTAVIIHIYYSDILESVVSYIKEIPKEIDIYITTSVEANIPIIHQIFTENGIENYQIVKVENRGRDCSALLVGCRDIIKKYRYLCFLHDKKTSGNNGACTVGEVFMESLFENLIGSEAYIHNVYYLLEHNSFLGIVAPPMPLHGQYFCLKENAWTCCYDKTVELAERIKLKSKMDYNKPPFILSTSFWCRTEALEPLWSYPFSYEDFVEEPMPEDGTISHAIERILPYVAQHQGFYSGVVMNEEYASVQISNLSYQLEGTVNIIKNRHSISSYDSFEHFDFEGFEAFCRRYSKLYIYGAGLYGGRYAKILKNMGMDIEGYIVSQKGQNDFFGGYPICSLKEFMENSVEEVGIVVAVSIYYQEEIKCLLEEEGIKNYYIV